jgi:hypothetical protein
VQRRAFEPPLAAGGAHCTPASHPVPRSATAPPTPRRCWRASHHMLSTDRGKQACADHLCLGTRDRDHRSRHPRKRASWVGPWRRPARRSGSGPGRRGGQQPARPTCVGFKCGDATERTTDTHWLRACAVAHLCATPRSPASSSSRQQIPRGDTHHSKCLVQSRSSHRTCAPIASQTAGLLVRRARYSPATAPQSATPPAHPSAARVASPAARAARQPAPPPDARCRRRRRRHRRRRCEEAAPPPPGRARAGEQ